jgi:two-component system, LytTR family, response regulator LytT
MKIVIIEDEKLTAKDLARTILAVEPDAEILAMLPSVETSIDFLEMNKNIDLIFSDIELGDGLSFEIFEKLSIRIPIIFCTAYNQYALEAFKTVGIDYLLKPFSKASILKAFEKYHLLKKSDKQPVNDFSEIYQLLQRESKPTKISSIVIQQGDKIIPIEIEKIAFFFIENDLVFGYTFEGKKHLLNHKLDKLEQQLEPSFFRANRQFLVNRTAVKDATHHFNRKVLINLNIPFNEEIVVGKLKVTAFVEWLGS